MINNHSIYLNPIIQPRLYCVKLLNLKQEPSTYTFPTLLNYLHIHPEHDLGDIILNSIIHPTPDSEPRYNLFCKTFLRSDDEELESAIGRYGAVQVFNREYNGTKYSVVKYLEQTNQLKWQVEELVGT